MQILVVGGGIQGLAVSVALAEHGHLVQLLERERPGQRASWVAAGLLTPSSPWKYPPHLIELCHASEALYADFVDELQRHTGIDSEHELGGMLYPVGVGCSAAEIETASAHRRRLGFGVEDVDRRALESLVPGLGPEVTAGAWQAHAARVRPPRLLAALRRRAEQLGVDVASECAVTELLSTSGRMDGVRIHTGQELGADLVVLAAGAWSGELAATCGLALDVRPVRGQILLLRGAPGTLAPTIIDGDSYLVPRRDGRILVGSTMEDAGFDAVTTPEALAHLRAHAARLLPATAAMEAETSWAGLRPGTPDRLPYLGPVDGLEGLVLATGHFRNGILLAPITARIVVDVVEGRRPPVDTGAYGVRPIDRTAPVVSA